MKKQVAFIVLFLVGLSLFAQNIREARIFVPQIVGSGSTEEKAFFYNKLIYEVVLQNFDLATSARENSDFILARRNSEYVLAGSIVSFDDFESIQQEYTSTLRTNTAPVPDRPIPSIRNNRDRREFFSWDVDNSAHFFDTTGEDNYTPRAAPPERQQQVRQQRTGSKVFLIQLIHRAKGNVILRDHIIFESTDSTLNDELAVILYNMLSTLSDIELKIDFRRNWLFVEAGAMWMPRMYSNEGEPSSLNLGNFGFKINMDIHVLEFLAVGVGAQLTWDRINYNAVEYHDMLLEFPLSLRFIFRPGDYFLIEPYGGVSYNMSINELTIPSQYSWFAGLQFGIKAGPGLITIDPRFSMDFYSSSIVGETEFNRTMIQIGLGYKLGFFPKRPIVLAY